MALGTEQEVAELPCGRDPLDVVDRARRGRINAHMRSCPFCQELIGADLPGGSAAATMREQVVQAPDTLLPAVMSTVWAELRPGRTIPLPTVNGAAFTTEQAISSMLEHTLDLIPDFVVHLCSVDAQDDETRDDDARDDDAHEQADVRESARHTPDTGHGEPDDAELRTAPALGIEVRAAAAYDADLLALATKARRVAVETLLHQFGLVADTIDITFVDVYEPQVAR